MMLPAIRANLRKVRDGMVAGRLVPVEGIGSTQNPSVSADLLVRASQT